MRPLIPRLACALVALALAGSAPASGQNRPGRGAAAPPPGWADSVGLSANQFVLIEAGTFSMGAANVGPDGQPIHEVTITKPFYLMKTEVTQAQWRAVMGQNPSQFTNCGNSCPVEQVSWNDIQLFLERLNASNTGGQYRLPTEAEWEYAARAATTGDYSLAGQLADFGWYFDNAGAHPHPVGQKIPNRWGLYDMHGNVWEWVQDRYSSSYYAVSPKSDPTGPETGATRVLRGGSWLYYANFARAGYRLIFVPSFRSNDFGFRLARTP